MEIFDAATYDSDGRFVESVKAKVRVACQNCPDNIEPGEYMVPDHHGLSRGRGWVHDECAN